MMTKIEGAVFAIAVATAAGVATPMGASASDVSETVRVEMPDGAAKNTVLIVNNHLARVTVYAVDEAGAAYRLGHLGRSGVQAFTIPEVAIDSEGTVVIKILPDGPMPGLGTPITAAAGIKTRVPVLSDSESVVFWLEPELTKSFTESVKP